MARVPEVDVRLDQLVLHGPGDDDRVRFGPGVTVFAGLGPSERTDLIGTVVDALTGRLANASISYVDADGEKVYADRIGATYATSGESAPRPDHLLGRDPAALGRLLTVTAADLGLDLDRTTSPAQVHEQLGRARADVDQLRRQYAELRERIELVAAWNEELVELDRRIARADDDADRWTWTELRRHRDEVRAELTMRRQGTDRHRDHHILDAVDALRATGEAWADAASSAAEIRAELGHVPDVAEVDLARVAATPAEPPTDLATRVEAWHTAADLRRGADAELALAEQPPTEPADELVVRFGELDQDRLWAAHAVLSEANEAYAQVADAVGGPGTDPETEAAVEAAHLEVIRYQRDVERRFIAGMLGSATFAVSALLAGTTISLPLGVVLLAASVAMGVWLLVVPRRRVAAAREAESAVLAAIGADSWLGLHLRRLDAVTDVAQKKRFERAAQARAAALVDWEEIAADLDHAALAERTDAVRARADAVDPRAIARRRDEARTFSQAALQAEVAARASLMSGLEPYGIIAGGGADLDPGQLPSLLANRIEAGRVAREARRLAVLDQREAEAARRLEDLLGHLGYPDGTLENRLERAISAVTAARQRQAADERPIADIETELQALDRQVAAGARRVWSDTPDPTGPPVDPDLLHARRRELSGLVSAAGRPDLVGAQRRHDLAVAHVSELERRLDDLAGGPASLQQRLIARLARTNLLGDRTDTVPVLVDDALSSVPTAERMELLDLLVRLSEHTQVIILTEDPVTGRWARDRSGHHAVLLYEADEEPAPMVIEAVHTPAHVTVLN